MLSVETKDWKKNEPLERFNARRSISDDIHIGDLVELLVDGRFFKGKDGTPERYAGYISSISDKTIGLATTPINNAKHGYVSREQEQQRHMTEIETNLVERYRILTTYATE